MAGAILLAHLHCMLREDFVLLHAELSKQLLCAVERDNFAGEWKHGFCSNINVSAICLYRTGDLSRDFL